jgi:hypothetical protein
MGDAEVMYRPGKPPVASGRQLQQKKKEQQQPVTTSHMGWDRGTAASASLPPSLDAN